MQKNTNEMLSLLIISLYGSDTCFVEYVRVRALHVGKETKVSGQLPMLQNPLADQLGGCFVAIGSRCFVTNITYINTVADIALISNDTSDR